MNQIKQLFSGLPWAQRIWLVAAAVGVVGGIITLAHWNQERDFKPLFTGLAAEDAGTLVSKLHEAGIDHRLADNGATILVASDRVAEARLQMATQGLPKSGRIGFELFDKANFGASEFAEQVNYHRAIEGELERSVMSIREVEQARVHITLAKDSLYTEARQPAKASVLVKLRTAAPLSPLHVAAICQLTASAVPGLSAGQVSVVDTNGNLLNRPRANENGEAGETEAALDYRKSVERDVQNKIAATLEPLLGADHFRIGVSADVDLTSGEQSEEVLDPQKSVRVTSQSTDDGPAPLSASGVPGTAFNQPWPAWKPSPGASDYARHTENVTYQTSRVVKHTRLPRGTVRKLSVAVLVDHTLRWEGSQRIVEPPAVEKLKVIRDLVAAATGLDTHRGDQLAVEAFPFESTLAAEPMTVGPPPVPTPVSPLPPWLKELAGQENFSIIAAIGVGAMLVVLIGLAMLLRKARGKKVADATVESLEASKASELAVPGDAQRQSETRMAEQQARQEAEALMALRVPAAATKKTEVLVKHIATEAKRDPAAMAHVVRSWLNGED